MPTPVALSDNTPSPPSQAPTPAVYGSTQQPVLAGTEPTARGDNVLLPAQLAPPASVIDSLVTVVTSSPPDMPTDNGVIPPIAGSYPKASPNG